jgi:hypothetical protein
VHFFFNQLLLIFFSVFQSKVSAEVIERSDINGLLSSIVTPLPNQDEVT